MDKFRLKSLVGKNTDIFSIYGYSTGFCILLLFINYGVFHKNPLLEFIDISFAITNILIVYLFLKKILYFRSEIKANTSIPIKHLDFHNIPIIILFIGLFLLIYFKDKSIYVFTAYSLGISFIFQSLLLTYFVFINKD